MSTHVRSSISLQAYVRHPELAPARANRDWAYEQLCNAVNTISGVAQATGASSAHPYEGAGELAAALDELMVRGKQNSEVNIIKIKFG